MYYLTADSFSSDFILPTFSIPPPNEVIGSLQRKIEAARGVFGKCNDGAGLSFTCHDGNEIASWSYYREPKCVFGLSLSQRPRSSKDLSMASQLLEAAIQGDPTHLRAFIVFYTYNASIKSELLAMSLEALQGQIDTKHDLQAAFRLSVWIQGEQGKDFKDKSRVNLHIRLFDLSMAEALQGRITLTLHQLNPYPTLEDLQFCTLLVKAAYSLATRLEDKQLLQLIQQLAKGINLKIDVSNTDSELALGEHCGACGSSVTFSPDTILQARCQKGHLWSELQGDNCCFFPSLLNFLFPSSLIQKGALLLWHFFKPALIRFAPFALMNQFDLQKLSVLYSSTC